MEGSPEVQKSGWCKCCDGKDANCRCFHHAFSGGKAVKILLLLVILGLVFAAGVSIGKRTSRHRGDMRGYQGCDGRGNYGCMPMMQYPGWYQGYNGQWAPSSGQGVPSATSSTPSAQ